METALIGLVLGAVVVLVGLAIAANNALSPPSSPVGEIVSFVGAAMFLGGIIDLVIWLMG